MVKLLRETVVRKEGRGAWLCNSVAFAFMRRLLRSCGALPFNASTDSKGTFDVGVRPYVCVSRFSLRGASVFCIEAPSYIWPTAASLKRHIQSQLAPKSSHISLSKSRPRECRSPWRKSHFSKLPRCVPTRSATRS